MTSLSSFLCTIWLSMLPIVMLPTSVSDALLLRIQEDIRDEVVDDSYDLVLENDRGQITIYGVVSSPQVHQSITESITQVSGVLAVDNRTTIAPEVFEPGYLKGPDNLAERVRQAIRESKPGGYRINIKSTGNRVILSGSADDIVVKKNIVAAASAVPGVAVVSESIAVPTETNYRPNFIKKDGTPSRAVTRQGEKSNEESINVAESTDDSPRPFKRQTKAIAPKPQSIVADVRDRIQRAGFLDTQVKVTESNGVITLKGDVPSPSEANKIHALILMAEGVKSINNHLTVKGEKYRAETIE